ncbi:dihydrodipicolinate synthase family protein [Nonomuraea sp. NPDC050556]|uniref:dihydrodipicolinate synthase family protein n=1 Tax=Nonomuraea sp. NPDC050556 TaxID=3364369 RepID=UPI003798B0F8
MTNRDQVNAVHPDERDQVNAAHPDERDQVNAAHRDGRDQVNGVYPAALTMFDKRGALDYAATAAHLDWLVTEGVHGLVIGGTSGEFVAMTDDERRLLLEVALETVAGRVPVLAGTGAYGTAQTIALTQHAAQAGASAALVVLPYFQRPSRGEILDHYRAIARAVDLPIWVYNIPANAAIDPLSPADLAGLYREGVASGVKSTLPTVHQVHELRQTTDDGFRVFYGGVTAPLEALAGGAHGWISGLLNVVPAAAVELWEAMQKGDLAAARTHWAGLLPYRRLTTDLALPGDLAVYRGLLRIWGRRAGHSRLPLRDLTTEELSTLERALKAI